MKVLWCVTGAGYLLEESCEALEWLSKKVEVTVAFSKAGREVEVMYCLLGRLEKSAKNVVFEEGQGSSTPIVCKLGSFDFVVVSPCTANTVAKAVLGIADSLPSNIIAQALKYGKTVYIVPTDFEREVKTIIPSGKKITLRCRDMDIKNARRLKKEKSIVIMKYPSDLRRLLKNVD